MIALFVALTIVFVHDFWNLDEGGGREAQRQLFLRNGAYVAASVAMFGIFAGLGERLPFVLVPPLLNL